MVFEKHPNIYQFLNHTILRLLATYQQLELLFENSYFQHSTVISRPLGSLINEYSAMLVLLATYLLCHQNGIVLLSLRPHTSHRMQPLDLTYFGPLKTAYNRECDLYMASNVGKRITQYEVVELFSKAFNRISNIGKAASGFQAAGIWPLDTTKIDEQFLEATLPDTQTILSSNVQTPEAQEAQASNQKEHVTPEAEVIMPIRQIAQLKEAIPLQEMVTLARVCPGLPRSVSGITASCCGVIQDTRCFVFSL